MSDLEKDFLKDIKMSIFVDRINRKEYFEYHEYSKYYTINEERVRLTQEQINQEERYTNEQKKNILQDKNIQYKYQFTPKIQSNIAGTLLCDFINCKFTEFDNLKLLIDKYSLAIIWGVLKELGYKEDVKRFLSKEEYYLILNTIVKDYGKILEKIRLNFISDINYLYMDNLEDIKDLSPYQRYFVKSYSNNYGKALNYFNSEKITVRLVNMDPSIISILRTDEKDAIKDVKNKEIFEMIKEKNKIVLTPHTLESEDIKQILLIELSELICINKFPIKICQNCGKHFVTTSRTDEVYCNNVYKDGKTCKEIGFVSYKKKLLADDDVARLYRNTYQQKLLRVRRNPENQKYIDDLESFRNQYKKVREDIDSGKMSKKDFEKWLLKVKDS
ncbi:MAG: DUF6076 domain-containing protein [Oscillospiraceae bacterium]|nr:DUF6076 domain-containing protein [Oscillospiraceae bacterium]